MKKLFKSFLGFSIGPVIGALISLITVPITTFFLSPEEFGKASMFTLFQTLAVSIIFLGIDQSYAREYHINSDKKILFQNSILIPLILSMLLLIIIMIFPDFFSLIMFDSKEYTVTVILFGVLIVASVIERFLLVFIRMEERAIEYSIFNIVIKMGILIVTLLLTFNGGRSFLVVVYSTIIGQLIADLFLVFKYRNLFNIKNIKIEKKLINSLVKFGLPLVIATVMLSFLNSLDRFFLRGFSDFYQIGVYTATLKIASVIGILKAAFTGFWIPTAYRWYNEKKDIQHFIFINELILILLTVFFYFLIFTREYSVLILSNEYSDAKYLVGLLCLPQILYTLSETTTLGIVFSGKSYLNITVSVLSVIVNIIVNIILTPYLGAIGAGISSSISYIVFFIVRTSYSNKLNFKIPTLKQYTSILLMFICAILNSFDHSYSMLINFMLFSITMLIQTSTLNTIKSIINKPEKWNFE